MKNSCRVELEILHATIDSLRELKQNGSSFFQCEMIPTPNLDMLVVRPRVGVGCVLISPIHPGCLLIGERQGSHGAGMWALPGGHLEQNEQFSECANKEVMEECGIDVGIDRWKMLHTSNDPMPDEDRHYVTIFQYAAISEEQTRAIINGEPNKCRGWSWIPFDEVKRMRIFTPLQNFCEAGGIEKLSVLQSSQCSDC